MSGANPRPTLREPVTHNAEYGSPVERVARILLDTADVHDLGWNNLRTTAEAVLPLLAEAWQEGYDVGWNDAEYPGHLARPNPYRTTDTPPELGDQ